MALALVGALLANSPAGVTQAEPIANLPGPPSPGAIGEQVAAALYNRAIALYELDDVASAKKLFVESLERSPDGRRTADALRMLRTCNEKLGVPDLDAGRPAAGGTSDAPLDPYASGGEPSGDAPVDPYASADDPVDPYAEGPGLGGLVGDEVGHDPGKTADKPANRGRTARTELMVSAGALGFVTGLAIAGPSSEDSEGNSGVNNEAIPLALAFGGGGLYLASRFAKKYDRGGGKALSSGAIWGMYNFAHLGNLFTGENTDGNDIYKSMALGGLVGGALGHVYARKFEPTEGEVSVVNSGSLIGTGVGLMLAVALDPPRGDAYSINAALGSLAGIGAGMYFRDSLVATPRRMTIVNLAALGGAVMPWGLVYPLLDGEDGGDYQTAGFLSALTMGGGAYLAWLFTKDMVPAAEDSPDDGPDGMASAPALLQRTGSGRWKLASPIPRPMQNQRLAPATGFSMGADVISGRF